MTTRYCDHGLYAAPVAAGTVPTAAEDGNGKGKTAATMATLVVAFTGLPTADQAITIAGVTFTAKASGATGNQFNIGADATATATNLKTAINASTTNAIKPTGAIAATAPLRNVVNACSSAGTVTVYTRVCGSEWNSTTETSTLSNCAVTQWSGGADGAWGYFANTASIAWPTSVGVLGYGLFAVIGPYLKPIAGDVIKVRGGKTLTATYPYSSISIGSLPTSTRAAPTFIEFDDGTEWSGDSATAIFALNVNGSTGPVTVNLSATTPFVMKGRNYGDGTYRFNLHGTQTWYGINMFFAGSGEMEGVKISSLFGVSLSGTGGEDQAAAWVLKECKVAAPNAGAWVAAGDTSYSKTIFFDECEFDATGTASPCTGFMSTGAYGQRYNFYFTQCKFTGFVAGSRLIAASTTNSQNYRLYFSGCEFGGVSVLGPNIAAWSNADIDDIVAASSPYGNRDFCIDTMFGFVEWNSNRSFPYCNAKLFDGVTGWAIHIIPSTIASRNSRFQFVETPRIGKINSLADGARTLVIELAIHTSLAWNKSHVSALIDYIDTSGNRQVVDTYDYNGGALTASTTTWNQEVSGQVTYVDGATQYHDKYKFSVATPTAIATGTEIGIAIRCHTNVPDATKGVFVDPEIQVV